MKLAEYATPDGRKERYACKIICKRKAPKDFIQKFMPRELDIIRKLDHESVIKVKSVFEFDSRVFIFMDLAENGELVQSRLRECVWVIEVHAVKRTILLQVICSVT